MQKQFKINRTFVTIGRWSAIISGVSAAGYGLASIAVGILATQAITWQGFEKFITGYSALPTLVIFSPPFVVTLVYPILALAVHALTPEERRPFALLALVFAAVYTAVLGSAYWVQLTFVPQSILEGNTQGLSFWVAWNPRGFFWALESFGYFMMGLSGLFLGLACKAQLRRTSRALVAMGPLGVLFMVNEALGDYPLGPVGSLGLVFVWVILFSFISFSLARWFSRGAGGEAGEERGATVV